MAFKIITALRLVTVMTPNTMLHITFTAPAPKICQGGVTLSSHITGKEKEAPVRKSANHGEEAEACLPACLPAFAAFSCTDGLVCWVPHSRAEQGYRKEGGQHDHAARVLGQVTAKQARRGRGNQGSSVGRLPPHPLGSPQLLPSSRLGALVCPAPL